MGVGKDRVFLEMAGLLQRISQWESRPALPVKRKYIERRIRNEMGKIDMRRKTGQCYE